MAKKYILGIDETGAFLLQGGGPSFVCGVEIQGNELSLRTAYQHLYEDFGFPSPTPTTCNGLLQTQDCIDDNARFHFNRLTASQIEMCKQRLLPHIRQVFVSSGRPALYANNQNWWLIAIVVVIRGYLKHTKFEPNSEIEVWIDNRNEKVWGIMEDERPEFKVYHDVLKTQIEQYVSKNVPSGCKLQIQFRSDTSNFFINLADITCGLMRRDKALFADKTTKCSCQSFTDNTDPLAYVNRNPLMAYMLIMQELSDCDTSHTTLIPELLSKLRKEVDEYTTAWDIFYELLKMKMHERSHVIALKGVVDGFRCELVNFPTALMPSKRLDMMVLMTEYYSHIGDCELPISREQFLAELQVVGADGETRIMRKWEKLVSYSLREAQILFNSYNFEQARKTFEAIYSTQERLVSCLPVEVFGGENRKDEPTAAILGTLAQSYAYCGDMENAIDYINLSKDYVIRTNNRADAYLCHAYHRMQSLEQCKTAFEAQVGMTLEPFSQKVDVTNQWNLLNYCKLVALDAYLNKGTRYTIPYEAVLKSEQTEYPFPLVRKWTAIALYLNDATTHARDIETLFGQAVKDLLHSDNGLAIRSLSLSVIQCWALINNQNPYHAHYGQYLQELKKQSSSFANYVDTQAPLLNSVKNEADMWQRAMALPFMYA